MEGQQCLCASGPSLLAALQHCPRAAWGGLSLLVWTVLTVRGLCLRGKGTGRTDGWVRPLCRPVWATWVVSGLRRLGPKAAWVGRLSGGTGADPSCRPPNGSRDRTPEPTQEHPGFQWRRGAGGGGGQEIGSGGGHLLTMRVDVGQTLTLTLIVTLTRRRFREQQSLDTCCLAPGARGGGVERKAQRLLGARVGLNQTVTLT